MGTGFNVGDFVRKRLDPSPTMEVVGVEVLNGVVTYWCWWWGMDGDKHEDQFAESSLEKAT